MRHDLRRLADIVVAEFLQYVFQQFNHAEFAGELFDWFKAVEVFADAEVISMSVSLQRPIGKAKVLW